MNACDDATSIHWLMSLIRFSHSLSFGLFRILRFGRSIHPADLMCKMRMAIHCNHHYRHCFLSCSSSSCFPLHTLLCANTDITIPSCIVMIAPFFFFNVLHLAGHCAGLVASLRLPPTFSVKEIGTTFNELFPNVYRDGGGGGTVNGKHIIVFSDTISTKGDLKAPMTGFTSNSIAYVRYH